MATLVSIIIPVYNRSSLIKATLESVKQQSFENYELIVIDDGSTDDTKIVAEKMISTLKINGSVFSIPNRGPDNARDFGMTKATGAFIAFLDSDDLWERDYLSKVVDTFQKCPEVNLIFSDFWVLNESHQTKVRKISTLSLFNQLKFETRPQNICIFKSDFFQYLLQEQPIFPSAMVFRSIILEELGPTTRYIQDRIGSLEWEFILRVAYHGKISLLNEPLVTIRKHEGNFSVDFIKQTKGEIVVLQTIQRIYSHENKYRKIINSELQKRSYSIGYQYFSNFDMSSARIWILKSLSRKITIQSLKYLILSCFPSAFIRFLQNTKSIQKKS